MINLSPMVLSVKTGGLSVKTGGRFYFERRNRSSNKPLNPSGLAPKFMKRSYSAPKAQQEADQQDVGRIGDKRNERGSAIHVLEYKFFCCELQVRR
jgi:hypothetical protein